MLCGGATIGWTEEDWGEREGTTANIVMVACLETKKIIISEKFARLRANSPYLAGVCGRTYEKWGFGLRSAR